MYSAQGSVASLSALGRCSGGLDQFAGGCGQPKEGPKVGLKRAFEESSTLHSCSSEESFAFAFFDRSGAPPASADLPCEETELVSEEYTGGLLDEDAESTQAAPGLLPHDRESVFAPEVMDMLRLALDREAELALEPNYMRNHDEAVQPTDYINADMRRLTVGWMGEVSREFGLSQETLFSACRIFDRFLSCSRKVPRICLQLVAVACLQIAAKNEEVYYPSVKSFTYIAGNAFSAEDLIKTETLVLRCLAWRIQLPTSYAFLCIYKHALAMDPRTVALACYMLELCQLEYSMLAYRPSQMAAAASMLALMYLSQHADASALARASCSSVFELKGCVELMLSLQKSAMLAVAPSPVAVVREEYRSPKWLGAACVTPFDCPPFPLRALPLSGAH